VVPRLNTRSGSRAHTAFRHLELWDPWFEPHLGHGCISTDFRHVRKTAKSVYLLGHVFLSSALVHTRLVCLWRDMSSYILLISLNNLTLCLHIYFLDVVWICVHSNYLHIISWGKLHAACQSVNLVTHLIILLKLQICGAVSPLQMCLHSTILRDRDSTFFATCRHVKFSDIRRSAVLSTERGCAFRMILIKIYQ
jgi:hypothetical protein